MTLKKITFETIKSVWATYLWPDRKTPIKPTNGLLINRTWKKEAEYFTPTFFGVFDNDKLIGVNSGHAVDDIYYRSRGIYVFPEYRGKGISQILLQAVQDQAVKEKRKILWSIPRKSALPIYLKFGFKLYSNKEAENMEFGPNFYVYKEINV